jgi:hypothetical protein
MFPIDVLRFSEFRTMRNHLSETLMLNDIPITSDYMSRWVVLKRRVGACLVAFFGFLKCNEFTCRANFDSNILGHIYVLDVIMLYPMTVQLFLKTSKIDKEYIIIA